ncbi:MAG: hypothetical protein ABSD46_08370, partial [Bacteroidota bacterium]
TLTIRIIGFTYQEIRGSVRSLNNLIGGFNPYTGTTTDNIQYGTSPDGYPEVIYQTTTPLTFYYGNLFFKDSIGSDSFPYTGKVEVEYGNECVYQVIFDETGSYPGTPWLGSSGMIYLKFTGYPGVQCPPGYHLNIEGTYDMQYGETTYIFTETLDGCGYHVNEPLESYFKYELVGDTLSGTLRDLTTGRTGAVLDSVGSSVIEFDARGKEPKESETITLKVSAVNGTIDPATGTINVYPPEVHAIPGKSVLTYGDTTSLTIEVRQPGGNWMPKPFDWFATRFDIVQADTFGFLYNMDSTIIGTSITIADPKIIYASNPETEPDSVEVLIQLYVREPCYNCGVGKIMPSDTMNIGNNHQLNNSVLVKQRLQSKISMKTTSSMLTQQLPNNISKKSASLTSSSIRVNDNLHYGLARLVLRKKHEILLGETKYYYATEDKGKLTIHDTTSPQLPSGAKVIRTDIWVDNPVSTVIDSANSGRKLGVYWEKKYPIYNGNTFTRMENLPTGMIRLVGRYWHKDSVYVVKLTTGNYSPSTSLNIEVKKPSKLGNDYGPSSSGGRKTTTKDCKGREYNLDSVLVSYAGKYGIAPQYIKAMIQKESNFDPSYRYEPFDDMLNLQQKNRAGHFIYESKTPYRILSASDRGSPDIPTDHSNILTAYGRISNYPGYQSIWEFYWEHIECYGITANTGYLGDGKENHWRDDRVKILKELYGDRTEDELTLTEKQIADDSTDARFFRWVRYTHNGGMENKVAQTRIMASYGLLQLVYYSADTRDYPKYNSQYIPEDINDYSKGIDAGIKHFIRGMNVVLDNNFENDTWQNGLESKYFEGLLIYNRNENYRIKIFNLLSNFLPKQ